MASAKSCRRFLSTDPVIRPVTSYNEFEFEFDESDVWGGTTQPEYTDFRSTPPVSRQTRRPMMTQSRKCGADPASLPVNIPDWSKILRDEYRDKWSAASFGAMDLDGGGTGGDHGDDEWVPPHEYLARTRNASLSVQEGKGRTLKGRDLSRVRNAIWEKTGFQD